MGTKTFRNDSGQPLTIQLSVRKGDTPGHSAGTQGLFLKAGESQDYTYSPDSENPYLDGIVAVADAAGSLISMQQAVMQRGSSVDDALNTHSKVTFSLTDNCLTAAYSN